MIYRGGRGIRTGKEAPLQFGLREKSAVLAGWGTVVKFVLQGQVNMTADKLRRRIYLILFWHCTIRTSKKTRPAVRR